ncbi:MAG: hypothetical protein FJY88_11550, partial [Candidatus Eisenbacteria bacterium]|nr:hypothetical protein [Candidatus Eisenbacteria bacterium]
MNRSLLFLTLLLCAVTAAATAQQSIVINEILYDDASTDDVNWVELKGTPGMSLSGYRVVGVDGATGCPTYQPISLTGYTMPADGYFVIAQSNLVPNYDLVSTAANYQNGPDNVQLQYGSDPNWTVVDALCYGTGGCFAGEGSPATDPSADISLARCPNGNDTNDNSVDFVADNSPTPGTANDASCGPPVPEDRNLCEIAADDPTTLRPALENHYVRVHGVALTSSYNWQTTNLEFQIADESGCCVTVFKGGATTPVIERGDFVQVLGTVGFYNGKTEVTDPYLVITVQSTGNPLPPPTVITTFEHSVNGERYEDCLLQFVCVSLTGETWPPPGSDANLQVNDGTGATTMRIDKETDIDGSPEPAGPFTVIGIGTQYDTTSPYSSGYQFLPRALTDFSDCIGACCDLTTGQCHFIAYNQCVPPMVWFGGTCEPQNPCPAVPVGACCFEDGHCELLTQAQCNAAPGHIAWLGELTVCEPVNPCPQPGACCDLATGACYFVLEQFCAPPLVWFGGPC